MFADTPLVTIEPVALSDQAAVSSLRIPTDSLWRSTIESRNELKYSAKVVALPVQTVALDDYTCGPIGFIKIDVEGHELAVLKGARQVLRRDRPNLLIEIEEQHNPGATTAVFNYLVEEGYSGFFFTLAGVQSVSDFDASRYQAPQSLNAAGARIARNGTYVNNFIFTPREKGIRLAMPPAI
jgi:hypothetical protein